MSARPMSFTAGDQRGGYQIAPGMQDGDLRRSASMSSATKVNANAPSKPGILTKKASLKKRTSLRRSKSGRSVTAGSIKAMDSDDEFHSAFYTPIPTTGTPTEALAERFQSWRKLLKDIITYFREIQSQYEARSKSLIKLSNVINNTQAPSTFLSSGGIEEANVILRGYYKHAIAESNKARDIEVDVITQLSGLRNDLSQKIKEIKSLASDFKNTVDKEQDNTRRAVEAYQESIHLANRDPASATGKHDPFIQRLTVERQIERQIEEENYLHRAYLNLEGSGRELESIVVGEIQKAYNAYAGILKREVDSSTNAIESLRTGPIAMPKDHEWASWIERDPHFVSPDIPLRKFEQISYPSKFDPAAAEIRAGHLERKSKYLKSYTPGWYVLSPTHLHEFKSPDNIHLQQPVMSLCLADQRLGSHSTEGSSSDKFSLKGRQTGAMHRGHSWVFRAESHDTMMAWYDDIRVLTEQTGAEKAAFLRRHARSVSANTNPSAPSVSSDGLDEDEADAMPFAANQQAVNSTELAERPKRVDAGGRFPSDIDTSARRESLQSPISPSSPSGESHHVDDATNGAAVAALHGQGTSAYDYAQPGQSDIHPALRIGSGSRQAASSNELSPTSSGLQPTPTSPLAAQELSTRPMTPTVAAAESGPLYEMPVAVVPGALLTAAAAQSVAEERKDAIAEPVSTLPEGVDGPLIAPVGEVLANSESGLESLGVSPVPSESPALVTSEQANGRPAFRQTGHLFPSVLRHDTDMSVSQMHVPGEFPPRRPSDQ